MLMKVLFYLFFMIFISNNYLLIFSLIVLILHIFLTLKFGVYLFYNFYFFFFDKFNLLMFFMILVVLFLLFFFFF